MHTMVTGVWRNLDQELQAGGRRRRAALAWRALDALDSGIKRVGGQRGLPQRRRCRGSRNQRLISASRISRKSSVCSDGGGGGDGCARFRALICLTIRKMMNAKIKKLIVTVRKLP